MNTEQTQKHILPIEGENPETGWCLEFTTNLPLNTPDGILIQQARITRGDGKFYDAAYLPANGEHNPTNYGAPGIIEKGKDGIVGNVLTMISKDSKQHILIATTKNVRMGNRGQEPMLETKRASVDNIATFSQIANLNHVIGQIYSNNARITGNQEAGAPINVGVALFSEPAPELDWMSLEQFALECQEGQSLAATFKAIAYLGLLKDLRLPETQ
jgi:hypothetical protein